LIPDSLSYEQGLWKTFIPHWSTFSSKTEEILLKARSPQLQVVIEHPVGTERPTGNYEIDLLNGSAATISSISFREGLIENYSVKSSCSLIELYEYAFNSKLNIFVMNEGFSHGTPCKDLKNILNVKKEEMVNRKFPVSSFERAAFLLLLSNRDRRNEIVKLGLVNFLLPAGTWRRMVIRKLYWRLRK
jgi:hypothetical protein